MFNADTPTGTGIIKLGSILPGTSTLNNQVTIDGFNAVVLQASGGLLAKGSGGESSGVVAPGLTTPGDLAIIGPVIAGGNGAGQSIFAGGELVVLPWTGTSKASVTPGLGAGLMLQGTSVTIDSGVALEMPSGNLTLHAVGPDTAPDSVSVSGTLDVGGQVKMLNTLSNYSDGGQIGLLSDNGNVDVGSGAYFNLSANPGGGNSGSLSVFAPSGTFTLGSPFTVGSSPSDNQIPILDARGGNGGAFTLDVSYLSAADGSITTELSTLETALSAGSFAQSQNIRLRLGDVSVDGLVKTQSFTLSTDQGSIDVAPTGTIDASGATGGAIALTANGSVTSIPGPS